jgi:hypothetical protein
VRRHHLSGASRASTPEEIAASLVAIHSTDPATVFLSVAARLRDVDPVQALERALYEDRTLIRMHGMRKTIFVFPAALAAIVQVSTTAANAVKLRADLLKDVQNHDPAWNEAWLSGLEEAVIAHLRQVGEASGTAISTAVPNLRQTIIYGAGTKSEARQGIASRVLRSLGNENRIVRGRPAGTWISGQYRWSVAEPHPPIEVAPAKAELIRCWLGAYGPGTAEDMKWWTGWPMRDVRAALALLETEEVQLAERIGYVLARDTGPDEPLAPDISLLPGLDSTSMGYRQRDWYLPSAYVPALFDRAGNIGPTIWWDGQIVGGWAQRQDGEIAYRFLGDVPADANAALEQEIDRLKTWIGPVRVTPRFRTPLERELAG